MRNSRSLLLLRFFYGTLVPWNLGLGVYAILVFVAHVSPLPVFSNPYVGLFINLPAGLLLLVVVFRWHLLSEEKSMVTDYGDSKQ